MNISVVITVTALLESIVLNVSASLVLLGTENSNLLITIMCNDSL